MFETRTLYIRPTSWSYDFWVSCEQLRVDAGVEEGHEEELVKMLLAVLQGQEMEVLEKELVGVL